MRNDSLDGVGGVRVGSGRVGLALEPGAGGDVYLLVLHGLLVGDLDGRVSAILSETHLRGKRGVWLPSGRLARASGLLHHSVDLLESKTLGLPDEEVGVDDTDDTGRSPKEENLGLEVGLVRVDEVRGDDGDDAVPEPVGRGRESDTTRPDGNGEDLTDDDPSGRSPGGGEEEDVDTDKGDLCLDDRVRSAVDGTGDGTDVLADDHTDGTPEEDSSTTVPLDDVEGKRGREGVDERGDQSDQEGVGDRSEGGEEDGTKVLREESASLDRV